ERLSPRALVVLVWAAGQLERRSTRAFGPLAADYVGDPQERLPIVRRPVVELGGRFDLDSAERRLVVGRPSCALARKVGEQGDLPAAQWSDRLVRGPALHAEHDGAVRQGVMDFADRSERD